MLYGPVYVVCHLGKLSIDDYVISQLNALARR